MKASTVIAIVLLALALLYGFSGCSGSAAVEPVAVWQSAINGNTVKAELRLAVTQNPDWPDELVIRMADEAWAYYGRYHPDQGFVSSPFPGYPDFIRGAGQVFAIEGKKLVNELAMLPNFPTGSRLLQVK